MFAPKIKHPESSHDYLIFSAGIQGSRDGAEMGGKYYFKGKEGIVHCQIKMSSLAIQYLANKLQLSI